MFEYQRSIYIDRPAAEVFRYVVAVDRIPEWVPTTVQAWQDSDGPAGKGTRLTEIVGLGFRPFQFRNELDWVISEFEENRLVVFENESQIGYQRQTFSLKQSNTGTELVIRGVHRLKGPFRLFEPMFRLFVTRGRREHLLNIKAVLETGGPGQQPVD